MNGGVAEYERVLKTFYSTDDNQEKKYALHSLGATPIALLKTRTLDWATKSGDVKLQDFFYAYGSCSSGKGFGGFVWEYFKSVSELFRARWIHRGRTLRLLSLS